MLNHVREKGNTISFLLLGFFIAVGMTYSAFIVSSSIERIKSGTISVKGFAEKKIISDQSIWKTRISTRSNDLKVSYAKLKEDTQKVVSYFESKGIKADQLSLSAIYTQTQYKYTSNGYQTSEIDSYTLDQWFEIKSQDVYGISKLSKESTELISQGIEFTSMDPEYYYSKFEDIKIQLIGDATKNAKQRAEQFAENSGAKVGFLRSASQGVFQVTTPYSTDTSGGGVYETSTIEKSVKSVITVEYSISKP